MNNLGVGGEIHDLRKTIQQLKSEIDSIDSSVTDLPELVDTANLRRSNEHLVQVNEKQRELIAAYERYSISLEDVISMLFTIQNSLKDVLKEQSSLIPDPKKRSRKR